MDYNACGITKIDNNGADAVRSTTSLMMLIVELMSGYTVTLVGRQRCIVDARVHFYFPVRENKNVTFLFVPVIWLVLVWWFPWCCADMEILLDEADDDGDNAYVL